MERTKAYLSVKHQGKDSPLPRNIVRDMNTLKVELAIPLVLHQRMIGILTLGKKKSDEDFSSDDIDIILPLARTLSIAISNAELFDQLSKTQAEAAQREKMAVIGTLSAGINHEICNPLGIVRGQCEAFMLNLKEGLYKNKTKEELLEKAMTIMEKTIKEVDRATGVTKRLSSFAKPIKEIKVDEVKIIDEINEVMALVGHELKLEKIDVIKDIPENLPSITADRKQVEEIFFNLIRNAGQAIGEKGTITIKARSNGNGKVIIDIKDTGHGIPEDKIEQIFNPFYTTKEPGKGTGLGLFIVRQIVEKNRGTISVKSKVGTGTTFTLEFPAAVKAEV
jgi:signal transduction histidine kinase